MGTKTVALILSAALLLWAAWLGAGEADDHWRTRQEDALTRLSADAEDGSAWIDLAEAALMRGDDATAASALTQVADLRPDDARGRFLTGCLALKQRRHEDARAAFARAVEIDPGFTEARFFLGRACRYLGHLEEALVHFAAVLTARPDYVAALTYRIRVLQDLWRSAERDASIAQLYALRAAGGVPLLNRASAYRRDRIAVAGGAAAVLERFAGEPVRWRAITAAGGVRRELVFCREGSGWMLVAVTDDGARRLGRWQTVPDYDLVRPLFSSVLNDTWPPAGEAVLIETAAAEADLDAGQ